MEELRASRNRHARAAISSLRLADFAFGAGKLKIARDGEKRCWSGSDPFRSTNNVFFRLIFFALSDGRRLDFGFLAGFGRVI